MIEPSGSHFSSPLLVVPKKSGEVRACIDYRKVNRHSIADRFPIPDIGETINCLGKAKIFSTLDIKDGFYHVQLVKESRPVLAFSSPVGLFQPMVLSMGLKQAPSVFSRVMQSNRVIWMHWSTVLELCGRYSRLCKRHRCAL